MHEDEARNYLANCKTDNVVTSLASTGRVNFTCQSWFHCHDADRLKQINLIDEGITLALVQHNQLLASGDMVATQNHSLLRVTAFPRTSCRHFAVNFHCFHFIHLLQARLIQTRFDHQSASIFEATSAVTHERLMQIRSVIDQFDVIEHSK